MSLLRAGNLLIAEKLQEAADALSSSELRKKLSSAVSQAHNGGGNYGYYLDHMGDEESGDCIYGCSDGTTSKAPYAKSDEAGNFAIDKAKAVRVQPRTVYQEVPDEAEHYAAMEAERLYTEGTVPLCERFVSKPERDAAGSGDFAGKGKSFPILKKEDVAAAARSIGRAGAGNSSVGTIKANIIRIAKAKGWASELPTAWQAKDADGDTDSASEAATVDITSDVVELKEGAVGQDGSLYQKVISPGWGSSGYYSSEMLERDLPKIYPTGTKSFWNHQTDAEESARPEGDLRDLASVTTEPVKFLKDGPAGPGGYVRSKAFEAYKQPIEDLHKHIGMSIRARGTAKEGTAPDGKKGRIIEKLTHGVSIDYVTTPGAGGQILQLFEAARSRPAQSTEVLIQESQGGVMDATELQKLQEANRNIAKRLAKAEAREAATAALSGIRLKEAVKVSIIERSVSNVPITEAGDFDSAAFKTIVEAELKYAASLMPEGAKVEGLGAAVVTDPAVLESRRAATEKDREFSLNRSAGAMRIETEQGKRVFREGRAAFDPTYNSRKKAVA